MKIQTPSDFQRALEQGPFAWPGGYPLCFFCWDGAALSFEAARENAELIEQALQDFAATGREGDDWLVICMDINWEDTDLYCVYTNVKIPSAYGEDT